MTEVKREPYPRIDFKTKQNLANREIEKLSSARCGYTYNSARRSPGMKQDIFQFWASPNEHTVSQNSSTLFDSANHITYYKALMHLITCILGLFQHAINIVNYVKMEGTKQ